jgi:hypothetical protein
MYTGRKVRVIFKRNKYITTLRYKITSCSYSLKLYIQNYLVATRNPRGIDISNVQMARLPGIQTKKYT